jgi:hypothetical protein
VDVVAASPLRNTTKNERASERKSCCGGSLGLAAGLLCGLDSQAQSPNPNSIQTNGEFQAEAPKEPRYIMPDLAISLAKRWEIKTE